MKKNMLYLTTAVILSAIFTACTADVTSIPLGVMLDQTSITLSPGETLSLAATVTPDDAAIKTVTWSSSDTTVATVVDGVVTGINEGEATITVTTNSASKTTSCFVTVAYSVSGVTFESPEVFLGVGESQYLRTIVIPDDAPDKTVAWESSNPAVASVVDGVVTAKALGTAVITVVTTVGHREATCRVTVTANNKSMFMTLQPTDFLSFSMSGSGTAYIDWGDGSAPETHTLSSDFSKYGHDYIDLSPCVIVIEGDDVKGLNCNNLQLTGLIVGKNSVLTTLSCNYNNISDLDLSNNTELTELNCRNNRMTSLNVSNTKIKSFDLSGNALENLIVSNNTELADFSCAYQLVKKLIVSNNPALTKLDCSWNNLKDSMDISNNPVLSELNCSNNKIKSLKLSVFPALTHLDCKNNKLTDLDVSNNPALFYLDCSQNQLTSLDMSSCATLFYLYCDHNLLSDKALNALFGTLNNKQGAKIIRFYSNPGSDTCDSSIATTKGWDGV